MSSASTQPSSVGAQRTLTLLTSGSFVVPAGCYLLDVTAIGAGAGGGGGGGGAYSNTSGQVPFLNGGGGGQGGASGYARRLFVPVVPGQVIPVVIGAGGAGGAGGTSGGPIAATTTGNAGSGANAGALGGPGAPTQFGGLIAHGAQTNGVGNNGSYAGGAGGQGGQFLGGSAPSPSYGGTVNGGGQNGRWPADYSTSTALSTQASGSTLYFNGSGLGAAGGDGNTSQGNAPYSALQRWWLPAFLAGSTVTLHPDTILAVEAYRAAGGPGGGGGPGYGITSVASAAGVWLATTGYSAGAAGSVNMGGVGGDLSVPATQYQSAVNGTLTAAQLLTINGAAGGNATAPGGGGGGGAGGGAIRGAGTTGQTVTGSTGGAGGKGGDGAVILRWTAA